MIIVVSFSMKMIMTYISNDKIICPVQMTHAMFQFHNPYNANERIPFYRLWFYYCEWILVMQKLCNQHTNFNPLPREHKFSIYQSKCVVYKWSFTKDLGKIYWESHKWMNSWTDLKTNSHGSSSIKCQFKQSHLYLSFFRVNLALIAKINYLPHWIYTRYDSPNTR